LPASVTPHVLLVDYRTTGSAILGCVASALIRSPTALAFTDNHEWIAFIRWMVGRVPFIGTACLTTYVLIMDFLCQVLLLSR